MLEDKIGDKASFRYNLISYFVTKMPRLRIYQEEKKVIKFVESVKEAGGSPENFGENATFLASHYINTVCGMKTYVLNPEGKNLMVYLHGGAFINRPTKHHMNFASKIALQTNSRVLVPYYPLSPFFTVTECIDKLCDFVKSINSKFVLLGDSAGGGLCFSLLYALQQRGLDNQVKTVVSVSPWLDMTKDNRIKKDRMLDKNAVWAITDSWRGDLPDNHPYCSPCFADFKKPFSALIIVGGKEILHEDTTLFVRSNQNQDIVYLDYCNLEHDFPLYPVPETKKALSQIKRYVDTYNENKQIDYEEWR